MAEQITMDTLFGTNPDGTPRTLAQALEEHRAAEQAKAQRNQPEE